MSRNRSGGVVLLIAALVIGAASSACGRKSAEKAAKEPAGEAHEVWQCPMHPQIVSVKPGKCPICHMDLVKTKLKAEAKPSEAKPAAEESAPATGAASVELSPEGAQAAHVKTVRAEVQDLTRVVRAVGSIEADERKLHHVASRVAGRLDRLFVSFTGQVVKKGDALYQIYSPDIVTSEREYLLALENRERARAGRDPSYQRSADELLSAARDRLRLWGLDDAQLSRIAREGKPELELTYRSPVNGTVLKKNVVEGQYVKEGDELYLLADLSDVWLYVSVYEYELGAFRQGQRVTVSVTSAPGGTIEGRVAFVDPVVDPATRTARLRVEFPNRDGSLRPGMFANAELSVTLGRRLAIPKTAVLDTGTRQLVYVKTGASAFQPREVKVGAASGALVEIISGIREGEEVVSAGGFLIDSQAQLATGASVQWSGASEVKAPEKKAEAPK